MLKEMLGGIRDFFKPQQQNQQNNSQQDKYRQDVMFNDEVVSFVKSEFERRKKERLHFELQWQLNMNFVLGNQYCDISLYTSSIEDIPKLYWFQEREAYNQIAPIIETRLSKLGRVDPTMKTRPATNEQSDISASKICTAFLKGNYRRMEMQQKIKTANVWMEYHGTVLYKNIWNPNAGMIIGTSNDEDFHMGDIETVVCPAFECYPDSIYSQDIASCRSFQHAKAFDVDEIENIYGKKVVGREVDVFNMSQTNLGTGGLGYISDVQRVSTVKKGNHEVVIEHYERPTPKFPEGRLIIVAGSELLHYGPLPYKIGESGLRDLPFVRQVCIERPGYFFGVSIIERLIPLQRSYNAIMNRINEFLNRCVIGVLTYEEGTIDVDELRENGIAPGSDIPHARGSQPPRFLDNGKLPGEFQSQLNKIENMFVVISGISTFARESAPPVGANSGIAMEIVKEQDDTRLSITAESIRLANVINGKHWLRLGKQFSHEPRMIKYVGKNNETLVMEWTASDLTTDDVVLETENELTQTPAQRKQMVMDLLNLGMFNDPETGSLSSKDKPKIFEMLQMGNWEYGDDISVLHVTRSQRENLFLEKGQAPMIIKYDNDDIHLQEHIKYILSGDFNELQQKNPALAQVMMVHIEEHEKAIEMKGQLEILKQSQQQQLAMAGAQQ